MRILSIALPLGFSLVLLAQDHNPKASQLSPAREDLLAAFNGPAAHCLALAKAIPEEKYTWRPMEGVRSFGEVFVHMAGSTLLLSSYAGLKIPDGPAHDLATVYMKRGFEMPEIFAAEAAIKSKATVLDVMDQAFHQPAIVLGRLSDADLEKPVDFFGSKITTREVLIILSEHLGEHLGQAIAYSRVNRIVPPWSK